MSYAVSDSPLGPYEKKGVIVDNTGCDPQSWNDHGSIASYKGNWYVFYHRSSQNTIFNRRMCAEPISFDEKGLIAEVTMTTQGVEGPLRADKPLAASRTCRMGYGAYVYPIGEGEEVLGNMKHGCWAGYRYLEFANETVCTLTCAAGEEGGTLEIWADGEMIGLCEVTGTGAWDAYQEFTCQVKPVEGVKALFLVAKGKERNKRLMEIKTICFK